MTAQPVRSATPPRSIEPVAARLNVEALGGFGLSAGVAGTIGAIGADQGGYFATTWGWAAIALAWAAALALVFRNRIRLTRLERGFLGSLTALVAWIALSAIWSTERAQTVNEIERALVYLTGGLAFLLVFRRRSVGDLLGGVLAGITLVCLYSLGTRLFPERLGTFDSFNRYRLFAPLGYWNALGLFASLATLLALGFSARGKRRLTRCLGAGCLLVLLPTAYFTFSRGAWIALAAGAVAMLALDPRRLQIVTAALVLLPLPALTVLLGARSGALTHVEAQLGRASHQGHRLALVMLLLLPVQVGLAAAFGFAERELRISRSVRRGYALILVTLCVAAVATVLVRFGGPAHIARSAYNGLKKPPVKVEAGQSLNKRLFSFGSKGRIDLWHVAWVDSTHHPLLGSGAGSYASYWYERRPSTQNVRDAHSLYLETLAELGWIGAALLVTLLLFPAVAMARARRHPLVPVAAGAYAAFLVHAIYDWDWEMPALVLAAFACAAAALIAARREAGRPPEVATRTRIALAVALVPVAGFALVAGIGNSAVDSGQKDLAAGRIAAAESQARKAQTWAPWSSEPWALLAKANLAAGHHDAAVKALETATKKDARDFRLWFELAFAARGEVRHEAVVRTRKLNPNIHKFPTS